MLEGGGFQGWGMGGFGVNWWDELGSDDENRDDNNNSIIKKYLILFNIGFVFGGRVEMWIVLKEGKLYNEFLLVIKVGGV